MTDDPIFTDGDSVEQEIEANHAREMHPDGSLLERALDTVLSPIANLLEGHDLTPEEAAAARHQHDRTFPPE